MSSVDLGIISVRGAAEHNLKNVDVDIERKSLTIITGVSGSGKSSLAFDTILAESQRRFFYTLSHYSRQFLDVSSRPNLRSIRGLSPAVALAQNETLPSRRATVGSLTELSELLGVMMARFGERHCPTHHVRTDAQSIDMIAERVVERFANQTVAICAPLVEQKKGHYATEFARFAARGFSKAYVDGRLENLSPAPKLAKEEKHTIKIIIDAVTVSEKNLERLKRSCARALEEAEGSGEVLPLDENKNFVKAVPFVFSTRSGCAICGFSWGQLDSRHFNPNSLGRCSHCDGWGFLDEEFQDEGSGGSSDQNEDALEESLHQLAIASSTCQICQGSGLDPKMRAITLRNKNMEQLLALSLEELRVFLLDLSTGSLQANPAARRVLEELLDGSKAQVDMGLGYLQLRRKIRSLSGGESQRLKLAGILGESLKGVLYVLDEPSQGLHPKEILTLSKALRTLRDLGNTVLVVDHDETLMREADWIIDLGPDGGARGGQLLAKFKPHDASRFTRVSKTAADLCKHAEASPAKANQVENNTAVLTVQKPRLNNLKLDAARFLLGKINVVTGVSGAGKSSLLLSVLFENILRMIDAENTGKKPPPPLYCAGIQNGHLVNQIEIVDRRPVAKSSVSMPATYLDVFTELRNFYGELPDAQVMGIDVAQFSLARSGGRCEECLGKGQIALKMRFLADQKVRCHVCQGRRYLPALLDVRYNGANLADVLEMTIEEACALFKNFPRIIRPLIPAVDLGLGYLKMGQPSSSLSGGEAQRLKLVPYFVKRYGEGAVIVLDEPTTGLHFSDVTKLMNCVRRLVEQKVTVIFIEHNLDVIKAADWMVDLGPGAASEGGELVYEGPPARISKRSQLYEFLL